MLWGPKYDGKYLRNLIRRILGNRRLHETITHLLIPTYDIKTLEPQIFSSYEVLKFTSLHLFLQKENSFSSILTNAGHGFDALLSDICVGTSSAPVYLPAHLFKTKDYHGNDRPYRWRHCSQ